MTPPSPAHLPPRLLRAAWAATILVAAAAATGSGASAPDAPPARTGVDLAAVPLGGVVAQGTPTGLGCLFPEGGMSLQLPPDARPVAGSLALDPATCELRLVELLPDDGGDGDPLGTDACTQRWGKASLWTQGYGGTWDKLTLVWSQLNYNAGCGSPPSIAWIDGRCETPGSWNGWNLYGCHGNYGYGTSAAWTYVRGSYYCSNWNFCISNDYNHHLYAEVDGYESGYYQCWWNWQGYMPPYIHYRCEGWTVYPGVNGGVANGNGYQNEWMHSGY